MKLPNILIKNLIETLTASYASVKEVEKAEHLLNAHFYSSVSPNHQEFVYPHTLASRMDGAPSDLRYALSAPATGKATTRTAYKGLKAALESAANAIIEDNSSITPNSGILHYAKVQLVLALLNELTKTFYKSMPIKTLDRIGESPDSYAFLDPSKPDLLNAPIFFTKHYDDIHVDIPAIGYKKTFNIRSIYDSTDSVKLNETLKKVLFQSLKKYCTEMVKVYTVYSNVVEGGVTTPDSFFGRHSKVASEAFSYSLHTAVAILDHIKDESE